MTCVRPKSITLPMKIPETNYKIPSTRFYTAPCENKWIYSLSSLFIFLMRKLRLKELKCPESDTEAAPGPDLKSFLLTSGSFHSLELWQNFYPICLSIFQAWRIIFETTNRYDIVKLLGPLITATLCSGEILSCGSI